MPDKRPFEGKMSPPTEVVPAPSEDEGPSKRDKVMEDAKKQAESRPNKSELRAKAQRVLDSETRFNEKIQRIDLLKAKILEVKAKKAAQEAKARAEAAGVSDQLVGTPPHTRPPHRRQQQRAALSGEASRPASLRLRSPRSAGRCCRQEPCGRRGGHVALDGRGGTVA